MRDEKTTSSITIRLFVTRYTQEPRWVIVSQKRVDGGGGVRTNRIISNVNTTQIYKRWKHLVI